MSSISEPTPAPFPHRKEIRSWLAPIASRSTSLALALALLDIVLFAAALGVVALADSVLVQLLAGLAAGVLIARLFILGHDACHQSLTEHRTLNRWLGRVLFLPSLTPYSLWEVGHNVVHHGYTNLKGFDFVWQPFTLDEYRALPAWRQALERIYRSGWGPGLYYLIEVWWRRMVFPSRRSMPTARAVFTRDCLLATAALAAWIGGLVWAAVAHDRSIAWMLVAGFVIPFGLWNVLVGFVLYAHHTHIGVDWYANKGDWAAAQPFVSTTVHLKFRSPVGPLLHHIMEHTAHHVDMSVPLYRLKKAQALLEEKLPGRIIVQPFSWRWYADTARRCKLYDLEARCWTDFEGRPTSA